MITTWRCLKCNFVTHSFEDYGEIEVGDTKPMNCKCTPTGEKALQVCLDVR